MSTPDHKMYPTTGVPYSAYRVSAKNLLHVNRAIKAIRRNDFDTLETIIKMDPSIHKKNGRMPILFYAIKEHKHHCVDVILRNDGTKYLAKAEVLSWLSRYFNINVYTTWKTSAYSGDNDLNTMLRYAVSDNYLGDKNLGKIDAMLWYGANPDADCGYPVTAREYTESFNPPCARLFVK